MPHQPPLQPADVALQLQRDIYYKGVETLRGMLPPPRTDTPEDWARRDRVALVMVAALVPASPPEARLAANHVAAMEQASDCLGQAAHATEPREADRLRAQASRMGREARGYVASLLRMQAAREKREATDAGSNSSARTEHGSFGLMTEGLERLLAAEAAVPGVPGAAAGAEAGLPAVSGAVAAAEAGVPAVSGAAAAAEALLPVAPGAAPAATLGQAPMPAVVPAEEAPPAVPAEEAPPAVCAFGQTTAEALPGAPAVVPAAETLPRRSAPGPAQAEAEADEPRSDPAAEAETYAIIYPRRARLIRQLGGLPEDCDFGPPEPVLVRAIVTGTSPALRALDTPGDAEG